MESRCWRWSQSASGHGMFGKAKKLMKKSAAPPAANDSGLPTPVSAKKPTSDNARRLQEIQAEQNDTAADGDNEAIITEAQLEPTLGEATEAEKAPVEEVQEPSPCPTSTFHPQGELVAIVGPVGSGKSSFLQACIGEMRQTSGCRPVGQREGRLLLSERLDSERYSAQQRPLRSTLR